MKTSERSGTAGTVLRRIAMAILRFGVAFGVLLYLFRRIPVDRVLGALRGADGFWVLAAFACTMALLWLVAIRLRRLIRAQDLAVSTFEAFEINLASRFYGLFLPAGNITGILVRVFKLSRLTSNYSGTGVAIAADRLASTLTLCLVGIVFWLVDLPGRGRVWAGLLGLTFVGIVFATVLAFGRGTLPFLERLGIPCLEGLHGALERLRSLGTDGLNRVFFLSVTAHLIGVASFWMLSRSLGLDADPLAMGWIRSCILLPTLIPVTVAGLGLREGAAVLLLGLFGVPEERALAFGLLIFVVTGLGVGLAGGVLEGWRLLFRSLPGDRTG